MTQQINAHPCDGSNSSTRRCRDLPGRRLDSFLASRSRYLWCSLSHGCGSRPVELFLNYALSSTTLVCVSWTSRTQNVYKVHSRNARGRRDDTIRLLITLKPRGKIQHIPSLMSAN